MKRDQPKTEGGRRTSVSYHISLNVLAILIPSLIIFIIVSCVTAAKAISGLNDKLLDVQTDYAISIVDDFFSGKMSAVKMFEENDSFQEYFASVSKPEDIAEYENKTQLLKELGDALERMKSEEVFQVWLADDKTDCYLLSNGEVVKAGLEDTSWHQKIGFANGGLVSEPYTDPASGEEIVSVVTSVFNTNSMETAGYVGFDVYLSSVTNLMAGIKVGEEGYMELLCEEGDYLYTTDPTAERKNVDELEISQEYKDSVKCGYNGVLNFTYSGISYTSIFRDSDITGWLAIATLPLSEVNSTRNQLILVLIILSILILAILITSIFMIIHRIMKPLKEISSDVEEFSKGNLQVDIKVRGNDEIGSLAHSVSWAVESLRNMIDDVSMVLGELSEGNLNVNIEGEYNGDFLFIREALEKIRESLNYTLGQISLAAEQVSSGSEQVSAGAQTLAQGASEQAVTVEELAANMEEMSGQISSNAQKASEVNEKVAVVGNEAEESKQRMKNMGEAMQAIRESSRQIGKIVKTIEDIAFQTNILALNASVEAARAGEAGSGFAVVAGEVRALASKSAEAARNTTALLQNSLNSVDNGTKIVQETTKFIQSVADGVTDIVGAVDEISKSSAEQARSAEQVSQGINRISGIVQMNSATAQESAAASEEFSAQALLLKELTDRFKLKN
ncbi:MAG: methyl-accepting chemotaxis protein [Eubacteriales bacterium]|nr:methyl-accepting chemotaxis protein [Eubacteriales bacterium]